MVFLWFSYGFPMVFGQPALWKTANSMSSTKSQLLNAELWQWQFFGRDEESDASEGEHVQAAICRQFRENSNRISNF